MTATAQPVTAAVAVLSTHSLVVDREEETSLEEMIFEVTTAALSAAGLSHATLDAVVLSGQDQTDGRVISCMTSSGPAAGVDRDVTMIASSGEHALIYGWLRLLSGQGRNVLVVGWSKPSESVHPEHAELVSAEPFVLRGIGMNDTLAAALQASRWVGADTPAVDDVVSWPLGRDDLPARADAVHATVLAVEDAVGDAQPVAWIRGAGWSTDAYELGSRDLAQQTSLRQAHSQVIGRPGVPHTPEWDTVEVAGASELAVGQVRTTLDLDPATVVNPSGSLRERPGSAHVAGLGRLLAAARSVSGGQGRKVAAGVGLHGFAGQGATVMVFSSEKE